jgi:hypothetical protein
MVEYSLFVLYFVIEDVNPTLRPSASALHAHQVEHPGTRDGVIFILLHRGCSPILRPASISPARAHQVEYAFTFLYFVIGDVTPILRPASIQPCTRAGWYSSFICFLYFVIRDTLPQHQY